LHKSLREWLTEPIPGTEVPKAGSYTADIASGDRLLAERGWMIYSEGKMAINPYYSRTLLRHLADTGQLKRLTEVLLDGELMEALWAGEQRCEWLRHMNVLRESVSLSKTIHEWLATRLSKGTATLEDAGKMSILSRMLQQLGAFDEAIHVAEQAIRIWELNGVTESPSMVQSLLSLGTIHRHRDEYGAALPYYDRALAIAEGTHNPNSRELADVLYELCVFHKETRNYEKSWECLNRCLAIRKQIEPPDYAGIADCINDRAVLLSAEGKPADLMSIYLEALSLFEKGYPDGHPEMATTLNNIAIELLKEGKSDDALATLRRGLRMAESLLIKYHPKCKSLRKDLVDLLHKKEKYQEALQLMRQQVIQSEIFPGPFHENTADIRLRLCQTIWEVFRFDEKFPREQLMVEIREQCSKVTSAHPFTVIGLLQASDKYYQTSEREVSQCLFDAACRGARGNAEKVTKDTAENIASKCFADFLDLLCSSDSFVDLRKQLLDVWGQAVPKVRDYGDSLARMRREVIRLISWSGQSRLLRMRDVTQVTSAFDLISEIGADTPETLDVLAALTVALHHQRYFMESERLCAQLAERSESMLGHNHLQTIQYVANLADLREHREDFEEAARLYLRVFETRRRIYGDQNEDTLFSLSCVAKCLLLDGRFGDAAALVHEIAENMPSSDAGNTARHVLALNLNGRAIELKNELSAFDAARKCYELSLELSPDDQVHTNLALLLWSCLKDIKEAEMHFQKAAKLNPDNGNLHTIYGLFLTHELLDNAKAQMHFEKADSLIPNENAHPGNRATLSIVQGDLDKSWKFAKRAMHLCLPKPDRIMARPLFCAAAVLLLKGSDAAIPLGQLRTLFDQGIDHVSWVTNALLDKLENELTPEFGQLMRSISDAINSKPAYQKLEANPVWLAIRPVGLDMPWPEM
jgi:tetratricopeptide (TPR) repeat protein